MADNDEWVVVGGKGRPRRTAEQQAKHLQTRAAAAEALAAVKHPHKHHIQQQQQQQHCRPLDSSSDGEDEDNLLTNNLPSGCSPAQYSAQQQLAILAAAMAKSPPAQQQSLPGWDPPPEREWKVAGSNSSRSRKKNSKLSMPRSPEEQVQHLKQQVLDISEQLMQTPMYASLLSAMRQAETTTTAASGYPCSSSSSSSMPPGDPQQIEGKQSSSSSSWAWQHVQQLVVYGLGSPDDSKVSRYQLALVLLLQRQLPGLQCAPQLFDPAFSDVDRMLLQQLGLEVILQNEECRRIVDGPTLFYLPHLEGALCDNVIAANWSAERLSQIAILGNSFTTYEVRWSAPEGCRPTTKRPDKLLQLLHEGAVLELPVPDHNFHVASAFNDTSLHLFTASRVPETPAGLSNGT